MLLPLLRQKSFLENLSIFVISGEGSWGYLSTPKTTPIVFPCGLLFAKFSKIQVRLMKIKPGILWWKNFKKKVHERGAEQRWETVHRLIKLNLYEPFSHFPYQKLSRSSTGEDTMGLSEAVISHSCFIVRVIDLFWKHRETPPPAKPSPLSSVVLSWPTVCVITASTRLSAVSGSVVPALENPAFFPPQVYK